MLLFTFEQLGPDKLKVLTIFQLQVLKGTTIQNLEIQWNLCLVDTFGTFPSVRLMEGVPRETSPAAKSEEKRMFSQAMVIFASFISLQQNEVKLKI